MNLVLLTHPAFMGSQSQAHLVRMMAAAFSARGHRTEVRQPRPYVHSRVPHRRLSKWAGYVDQFILFPRELERLAARDPADTLYVFCDQALGPWVPVVAHRPHVVHCLDLLALRSALGLIPENPTSATGRIYQRYIRAGFRRARHFVSISEKSRTDLHEFGGVRPITSEVVPLGLNHPYQPLACDVARQVLARHGITAPPAGLLLHVGGGQWYKNTGGVLSLYSAYVLQRRACGHAALPLWLVSPAPGERLRRLVESVTPGGEVRFLQGIGNEALNALYSLAGALIFPSLAEGFGWPIAEALACGCPVITTGEAPMTEVGGRHAHYLPKPVGLDALQGWSQTGAKLLCDLLDRPGHERQACARAGIEWARRFNSDTAIERYLDIYRAVLRTESEPPLHSLPSS